MWARVVDSISERRLAEVDHLMTTIGKTVLNDPRYGVPKYHKRLNLPYCNLLTDLEIYCSAMFVRDAECQRFWFELMGFYAEGYWPCGWQGRFPFGRLVVW